MTNWTVLADALADTAHHINTRRPLSVVMHDLVTTVRDAVTGVDQVGITITHRDGDLETIAWTDELVVRLDRLQDHLHEGPALRAPRESENVLIDNTILDARWPRFCADAKDMGVRSQLGLRLFADDGTVGGLNLYATGLTGIDPEVEHVASLFAGHAELALNKARLEANLRAGIRTRQHIGVAVGIVMERYGLDQERAFEYLSRVSQTSNTKLGKVADELIRVTREPGPDRTA